MYFQNLLNKVLALIQLILDSAFLQGMFAAEAISFDNILTALVILFECNRKLSICIWFLIWMQFIKGILNLDIGTSKLTNWF